VRLSATPMTSTLPGGIQSIISALVYRMLWPCLAACSQAAHSGLWRRPAKRGSSWERFLKDLTGGSGVGLVPSQPQSHTHRRSTQSHNRTRSWRWCPSPSGPLSSPSSKAGREIDHLISGPTILRSLKVHGPRCQDWLFSQSYFPGGKQPGHAVHWVAGAHCCGPRGQPWKVFRGARDQHRAAGASQRSSEAHQHLVAGLDRGTRPPGWEGKVGVHHDHHGARRTEWEISPQRLG
jgi:hypothetical protein